jgi:type IV secretory pathway VirJ component
MISRCLGSLALVMGVFGCRGLPARPPVFDRVAHTDSLRDLPIVELPATGPASSAMAIIVSGDGGWAKIDKQIGGALAAEGVPVVGLDSRAYFRQSRTPQQASRDLARLMRQYLHAWGKRRVILVGYSRGADVLPFMADDLPDSLRRHVSEIALLGAANHASFTFHLVDLVMDRHRKSDLATLPAIEALTGARVLCFYGTRETDTVCPALRRSVATIIAMPGGHHFGGDYRAMAMRILTASQSHLAGS